MGNKDNGVRLGATKGVVKWFSPEKGFGFVTLEDGREAFVHFSKVRNREHLAEGQNVVGQLWKGDKGLYCTDVEPDQS